MCKNFTLYINTSVKILHFARFYTKLARFYTNSCILLRPPVYYKCLKQDRKEDDNMRYGFLHTEYYKGQQKRIEVLSNA